MKKPTIKDGDLLAYLEGDELPHVAEALSSSIALQAELDDLREAHDLLLAEYGGILIPDPQDMVDVATGQASASQKLLVAAYLRHNPAQQVEMAALEDEFGRSMPTENKARMWSLPHFLAHPLGLAGVRTYSLGQQEPQAYYCAEVQAQVTLQIPPAINDYWSVQGYVTHMEEPLSAAYLTLQNDENMFEQTTDDMGFFSFDVIPFGRYELRLHLAEGIILIPDIVLTDD